MPILVFLSLLFIVAACNTGTEPATLPKKPVPDKKFTITHFTDTLTKQDTAAPGAIENALQLFNAMVPEDSTFADSAASALFQFIHKVVARKNDSLFRNFSDSNTLAYPTSEPFTEKQKTLLSALHASRLQVVGDGEGGIYLVPRYETILPGIKAKTAAAVDSFLDLIAKEDTTPTFLDAGLAIEIETLADRLITSEQLLAQTLPDYFKAEITALNRFYTHALIMGSDNSPSLDHGTTILSEDFKKGYDYLLAKYPSANATQTVKAWMAVIASGDEKQLEAFRKKFL
jgi:hypothetical protein